MISASLVKELREMSGAGMLDCKKALEATNGNMEEAMTYLREKGIASAAKKQSRIAAEGLAAILIDGNSASIVEVNSETDFVAKNSEFQDLVNETLKAVISNDVNNVEDALNLQVNGSTLNDLFIAKTSKIGEKLSFRRFAKMTKNDNESFGSYIHMGGKIAVLILLEGASSEVAKEVAMHAAAMRPKYVKISDVPEAEVEKEREILKEQAINEGKESDIAAKMVEGRIKKFYKEICLEEQDFVKDSDMTVGAFVKSKNGSIVNMVRFEVGEGIEKKEENFAEEVMNQIKG